MAPPPLFFNSPIRYMRYAAHQFPALYYSVVIGAISPVILLGAPWARNKLGYENSPKIPMTYPIPNRARGSVDARYDD